MERDKSQPDNPHIERSLFFSRPVLLKEAVLPNGTRVPFVIKCYWTEKRKSFAESRVGQFLNELGLNYSSLIFNLT